MNIVTVTINAKGENQPEGWFSMSINLPPEQNLECTKAQLEEVIIAVLQPGACSCDDEDTDPEDPCPKPIEPDPESKVPLPQSLEKAIRDATAPSRRKAPNPTKT